MKLWFGGTIIRQNYNNLLAHIKHSQNNEINLFLIFCRLFSILYISDQLSNVECLKEAVVQQAYFQP
jgi:hypothetical protein